jgi:hypothetical protein
MCTSPPRGRRGSAGWVRVGVQGRVCIASEPVAGVGSARVVFELARV